ncbi:hypothetical protein ES332_A05G384500v1 [Gossypium tomentosum]|uniref:ABC transporter domain-containing protein n=1 Tax=Gossypium tomentosum TaxID=34277 RepID=A0A5D2QQ95_GOSTO|nr:hypothetical protein ES332_A05G384500v1 [Gossypium tomentosum]
MSRIVTENISSANSSNNSCQYFQPSLELIAGELSTATGPSPTLGQLLKHVGDARKEATGDETPVHEVLVNVTEPRPIPFFLSFNNLTYSVKVPRKMGLPGFFRRRGGSASADAAVVGSPLAAGDSYFTRNKTLLNNISGETRDGEILAVLGASGSGKSTLIDALANRIAKGSLKGNVTLNGEALESRMLKVISAYVMQDDLLFPMLTVEETLMFAAEFRLPRTLSKSKKKMRVQALIDQLGLRNAAKTVIGDEGHRGVSGGERRRVSIGIDIIHDPIILFLDEPTSGLDSTSAFMVVKVLQRIAQSGSMVVMSIHQPSYRILGLLDRLIFLSRGQTVYSGSPTNLPLYFSEFGYPIPENENKTDFALDLIRELEGSPGGTKSLVEFNETWQSMKHTRDSEPDELGLSLKEAISASIFRGKLVPGATNDINSSSMVPTFANPFWKEMVVLSKRSILNSRRMPELFGTRLAAVLVTGFILATVFWQLDNSPKGVQERLGFFAFAMSTTYYTCADALPVFLQERYIFMRETAYNAYRRLSYVISNALAVGLDGGLSGFLFYFLMMFASFWSGSSFVTFLSGVVPHVMLGYTIVVAILAYWIWFHYLSLVKYPYEAVLQNEFENPTKCFVRGIQIFDNSPLGVVPPAMKVRLLQSLSNTLGMRITSSTCLTTGLDILKQEGITDLSKWNCLLITVAWGFLFRVLFYFSLLLGSKNKRS